MANYWQKYGLINDPFVADGLECKPFLPSRWHQQLDLLRHLARSSNMVLLVTGISGVGKTTFLEMFFDKIESKVGVCKIHGSNGITPDVLQELIIRHIGMSSSGSSEANFQQRFVQQIERMHQKKDEFYLVIDNAHKLPKSSLALLVDAAEWQSSETHPLHIILFGGPQLDAMMAEITVQHLGEAMTHTIRIEPFSLEMAKDYILYRLTQAGFIGSYPLTEQQSNQIHQASNGIPAKINIIARQILLDHEPKNTKRKPTKVNQDAKSHSREKALQNHQIASSTSFMMWLITGLAAVIGIILFVVYYFRAPENTQTTQILAQTTALSVANPNPQTVENSKVTQSDVDEDQTQTEGLNGMVTTTHPTVYISGSSEQINDTTSMEQTPPPQLNQPTMLAEQTPIPQSNEPTALIAQNQPAEASAKDNSTDTNLVSQKQNIAPTQQPMPAEQNAISTWTPLHSMPANVVQPSDSPAETKTVAKKTSTKLRNTTPTTKQMPVHNTLSLTSDEQALMASDGARFTLQIAAAADYQGLKEFIKMVGLDGQVYFFRTLNSGKPWYVAVYGDFSNETAAKAAINKLPATLLAKEHPWPRSFSNIQKAIKVRT